ncbi:MAG: hypothetical protein E7020_01595 [Alphaproteobacteria bacterium]|nr:hypothetical protein [Alphaproteobacteria bacterium]
MKKLFIHINIFICLLLATNVFAQEGGQIILDLRDDEIEKSDNESRPGLAAWALFYYRDVKEYSERLPEQYMGKDFTGELISKYPVFNQITADKWQDYVRTGIKYYRWFNKIKEKVVSSIMKKDPPIVVADDQYEMGEEEEYIKTDKPLIIHDFKKVVAYSNSERDKLAVQEKLAKDNNLPLPSQAIEKYKKALIERDWKTLLDINWDKTLTDLGVYKNVDGKNDVDDEMLIGTILTEKSSIDEEGIIKGVIKVEPRKGRIFLLGDFEKYEGAKVDFSKSENLENIEINFIEPQIVELEDKRQILIYGSGFPIYFKAKAKDVSKPLVLRPIVEANMCLESECIREKIEPEITLSKEEKIKDTVFSAYIRTIEKNVPREKNKNNFNFGTLVLEKQEKGNQSFVRLDVKTDNIVYLKTFIIGRYAKYFAKPMIRFDGDSAIIRFPIIDKEFDALGKEITFWVLTSGVNQYLHSARIENMSLLDTKTGQFTLGILWLAFFGGMLLNLMPCVFPVLSLKLLAFTKFGGLNVKQIRRNFLCNSLGILLSFILITSLLVALKLAGYALGWGMQFQNIYFVAFIIWVVVFFLAHVFGIINLQSPRFLTDLIKNKENQGKCFEFLSGVFLVLLSTPCMAPYLGTAFGVALAGNIEHIILTVMTVGLGLSAPYIVIALCPQLAFYMPKPGKWMATINLGMILLLLITIIWLVSVLVAQTSTSQIWHWLIYIGFVLLTLYFAKAFANEVDKLKDRKIAQLLHRRYRRFFGIIVLIVLVISMFDAGHAANKRRILIENTKFDAIDLEMINQEVKAKYKVLIKVGADWCLTCKYNDNFVFDVQSMKDAFENYKVHLVEVDWTNYQPQVLDFMQEYGRRGLPFYILFSPTFPDGIVLPEMLNTDDLYRFIEM